MKLLSYICSIACRVAPQNNLSTSLIMSIDEVYNKFCKELYASLGYSGAFDYLLRQAAEAIMNQYKRQEALLVRHTLECVFSANDEDVRSPVSIVISTDQGTETMHLTDYTDCFGRITGGTYPTNLPDWLGLTIAYSPEHKVYVARVSFCVPPLKTKPQKLLGLTVVEHRAKAIDDYEHKEALIQAALRGDIENYNTHRINAFRVYATKVSTPTST